MALQMRQNLNLRMEQKLKLTPQMIQSIEILLLPQLALEERLMNEVESNPVLEVVDQEGSGEDGDIPDGLGERPRTSDDGPAKRSKATSATVCMAMIRNGCSSHAPAVDCLMRTGLTKWRPWRQARTSRRPWRSTCSISYASPK